jgi:hypothetical protein
MVASEESPSNEALENLIESAIRTRAWELAAVAFRALCEIVPYFVWVRLPLQQQALPSVLSWSSARKRCAMELSGVGPEDIQIDV